MHVRIYPTLVAFFLTALAVMGSSENESGASLQSDLPGSWVSLNHAAIDRSSMRARDFSITRFELQMGDRIVITKQSFILAGNGEYLVFTDTLTGRLLKKDDIFCLEADDGRWQLNLERKGINRDGSFSVMQLELIPLQQARSTRGAIFLETYYRVPAPDSKVLEGAWVLAADVGSDPDETLLTIADGFVFMAKGLRSDALGNHIALPSGVAVESGFWNLTGDQLLLVFQDAKPTTEERDMLTLHFLGFNGNQMRLLDQRGYIWKMVKQ